MEQIKRNSFTKVIVLGDPIQVIRKMISSYRKGAIKIRRSYDQIKQTSINIHTSFHILRRNNLESDILANQGAKLKIEISRVNGILTTPSYVP